MHNEEFKFNLSILNWINSKPFKIKSGKDWSRMNGLRIESTMHAHLYLVYCIIENIGPVEIFGTPERPYRGNPIR